MSIRQDWIYVVYLHSRASLVGEGLTTGVGHVEVIKVKLGGKMVNRDGVVEREERTSV